MNIEIFRPTPENDKLEIKFSGRLEEGDLTKIEIFTSQTYHNKDAGINVKDYFTSSLNQHVFIPAMALGELFFSGMYIIKITATVTPAGTVSRDYFAVVALMSNQILCLLKGADALEVENCKLLVSTPCGCVDDIVHSFINLEALKYLFDTYNIKLACEIYNDLKCKNSLNCLSLAELEKEVIYSYITIDNKIILANV